MPRTTFDIDGPILHDVRVLARKEKKAMGRLASELLALGLAERGKRAKARPPFKWIAKDMRPRMDFTCIGEVLDALDVADGRLPRP